ncbi:MAG: SCP2 sterol-binding domain-containing protein [Pseudomonadota bacterium]
MIRRDEQMFEIAAQLEGKTVLLEIEGIGLNIYAYFSAAKLTLSRDLPDSVDAPDVTLSGKVQDFVALAKQRRDGRSMGAGQVEIQGELNTAQLVQDLLENAELDLEDLLAEFTNDAVAYRLSRFAREGFNRIKAGFDALEQDASEFIQYEQRLTPSSAELLAFSQEVDELALRVERLETRIKRKLAT